MSHPQSPSEATEKVKAKLSFKLKISLSSRPRDKVKVLGKYVSLTASASYCRSSPSDVFLADAATTKLSRLQIELSYLSYLRTRLVRDGATYSSSLNLFFGDLMQT